MFVYAHTSSGKSRDLGAWASALLSIILPSLEPTHKIGTSINRQAMACVVITQTQWSQ